MKSLLRFYEDLRAAVEKQPGLGRDVYVDSVGLCCTLGSLGANHMAAPKGAPGLRDWILYNYDITCEEYATVLSANDIDLSETPEQRRERMLAWLQDRITP